MRKVDRRVKKTISALRKAYLRLLELYEDKEINVSMITQEADLNRATFYTHYTNKQEFLDEMMYDALDGLRDAILSAFQGKSKIEVNQLTPTTERIFRYFEENKKTFNVLSTGHPELKSKLESLFIDIFTNDIHIETKSDIGKIDYDIYLHYQTSATIGMIHHWMKNKFEYPAEYMMEQLTILSNAKIISLSRK